MRQYISPPFKVLTVNRVFEQQLITDTSGKSGVALVTSTLSNSTGTIQIVDAFFGVVEMAATGGITLLLPLTPGVTITLAGHTLTGINVARTPGADDFNVLATNLAVELADAINDPLNTPHAHVVATPLGTDFVGLVAVIPGIAGNSIALVTNTATEVFLSHTTLLGGGQSAGSSALQVGQFSLVTGVHWNTVPGDAALSAVQLAASIERLPGYSATPVADTVTVIGPMGMNDADLQFKALYQGTAVNFTLVPNTGFLGGGAPRLGPPVIS
jgi:hypothetical protein